MNTNHLTYKPFKGWVESPMYRYKGHLVRSMGGTRWLVRVTESDIANPAWFVEADVFNVIPVINEVPEYWCFNCYDSGIINVASGYEICECRNCVVSPWADWMFNASQSLIPDYDLLPPF